MSEFKVGDIVSVRGTVVDIDTPSDGIGDFAKVRITGATGQWLMTERLTLVERPVRTVEVTLTEEQLLWLSVRGTPGLAQVVRDALDSLDA